VFRLQQTSIHGKHFLEAEQSRDELFILSEYVAVERPWSKTEQAGLVPERSDYTWMTMALVDGAVRTQEVVVTIALHVPDIHACTIATRSSSLKRGFHPTQLTQRRPKERCVWPTIIRRVPQNVIITTRFVTFASSIRQRAPCHLILLWY